MEMKRRALFFTLIAVIVSDSLSAADLVRVKDILDDHYRFRNNIVGLIGIVSQLQDEKTADSVSYFLKDSWGDRIKIVTENDSPVLDNLYEIKGAVILGDIKDKASEKEICIVEMARRKISNLDKRENPMADWPTQEKRNVTTYFFLSGIAVLLISLSALLYWLKRASNRDVTTDQPFSSFPGSLDTGLSEYPEPAEYIEYISAYEDNVIKITEPPDGTLTSFPPKLVIVLGYNVIRDITFWSVPGQEETLFEFGRDPAPRSSFWYTQLKSATVSSKQATFLVKNKKFILINYSTTPPSIVNGVPMELHQSITLKNGDLIKMGQFVFLYYEVDSRSPY